MQHFLIYTVCYMCTQLQKLKKFKQKEEIKYQSTPQYNIIEQMHKIHPETTIPHIQTRQEQQQNDDIEPAQSPPNLTTARRRSLMDIPVKKFAAQDFDEKAVLLCQFCGGANCKQEDFKTNKIQPNAIQGLHSNWITDNILAMQRPSERLIKQYGLYEKFKKEKINTILNLQEPGEHPYCGDGLMPMVGFSYNPEGFYNQGIKFFNESWEDMTATTFQHMMRIMNLFYVSLVKEKGKISVHCHAGRGRTLLVICSWLIYYDRMSAKATIDLAVQKRQGVLTKSSQRQFLEDFEQQLKLRWKTYGPVCRKSFTEFVQAQSSSLLKHQQNACKFRPYVHQNIFDELRSRIETDPNKSKQILMAMLNCQSQYFEKKWNHQLQQELRHFKHKINHHTLFNKEKHLVKNADTRILTQLLYDFYDGLPFALISIHALQFLVSFSQKFQKQKEIKKLNALLQPQFVHETGVQAIAVMLDLLYFVKTLIKNNLNLIKQGEDVQKCECLFIRLSILLSGKRKYCQKIFPHHNHRQCKLLNYSAEKRQKYTSNDEIKLANFIQSLLVELGDDISQIDSFITKIRKIDSNLHYFTKSHESQENGGFIRKEEARKIYENSRI